MYYFSPGCGISFYLAKMSARQDELMKTVCEPRKDLYALPATVAADRMSRVCSMPEMMIKQPYPSPIMPHRVSFESAAIRPTAESSFTTADLFGSLEGEAMSSHLPFPEIKWTSDKGDKKTTDYQPCHQSPQLPVGQRSWPGDHLPQKAPTSLRRSKNEYNMVIG